MSSGGIVVNDVARSFGEVQAVRGMDLVAPAGRVTALVGPNGAGKTTLLLILATLLAPDRGSLSVDGIDALADPVGARSHIGWSPDVFGTYDALTSREYLAFFHEAYRLPKAHRASRVAEVLAEVGAEDLTDRPLSQLSRGQKQKVGLARALVHNPTTLLLDEPAAGLDPRARVELRDLLRALARRGSTVLVSSHVLSDLEETADRAVFVDRGRIVGEHDIATLHVVSARPWRLRALDLDALDRALAAAGIEAAAPGDHAREVMLGSDEAAADLLAALVHDGVRLTAFAPAGGTLEAAFLEMTGGAEEATA